MKKEQIKVIITGGAGFIGGSLIRKLINDKKYLIYNIDKLGYASDISWIKNRKDYSKRHFFLNKDLKDKEFIYKLVSDIKPQLIINFAAESHVDRSIETPINFIESNIVGTFNLLEAARTYWEGLSIKDKSLFKFIHISTDEVFGSLQECGKFDENSNYDPRSPYSASKAASDHLVRSWNHTYGLPTMITNCSNNYGPYQFPEKLIPLSILKALNGEKIPLYGNGLNIRDWLFVEDHIDAIMLVAKKGNIGESYCIGGSEEKTNKNVLENICRIMDINCPKDYNHSSLIQKVADRPGHDKRYAINAQKIKKELGWAPKINFEEGLKITIEWYLKNLNWCDLVMKNSAYKGKRLGL
tara:strand:+ start:3781 stop:4845 length:1065 start_codon:yes stop_codon:yes gene_type:complete